MVRLVMFAQVGEVLVEKSKKVAIVFDTVLKVVQAV